MTKSDYPYMEGQYLYPPRPEDAVLPGMLDFYETRKWLAQVKKNGTCTVIMVSPDKRIKFMTRHNTDHKQWSPTPEILEPFLQLPNRWFYFCGELLHNKTKNIKNTLYLFDLLVSNDITLIGTTYLDRYQEMLSLFKIADVQPQYSIVSNNLWIANNYRLGFRVLFDSLKNTEDEGIVLRDPKATLAVCCSEKSNNNWVVKCRKQSKGYGF